MARHHRELCGRHVIPAAGQKTTTRLTPAAAATSLDLWYHAKSGVDQNASVSAVLFFLPLHLWCTNGRWG